MKLKVGGKKKSYLIIRGTQFPQSLNHRRQCGSTKKPPFKHTSQVLLTPVNALFINTTYHNNYQLERLLPTPSVQKTVAAASHVRWSICLRSCYDRNIISDSAHTTGN